MGKKRILETMFKQDKTVLADRQLCLTKSISFDKTVSVGNIIAFFEKFTAKRYCEEGHSVVIIDNTNIAAWESRHYVGLASTYGYIVVMITPSGHFTTSAQTLATRNKHGVDVDVIRSRLEVGTGYNHGCR